MRYGKREKGKGKRKKGVKECPGFGICTAVVDGGPSGLRLDVGE